MTRYQLEIRHERLNKYRCLTGSDPSVLAARAEAIYHQWAEQWERVSAREHARAGREAKKQEAFDRTNEAVRNLKELESILARTINVHDAVDWGSLKQKGVFREPSPKRGAPERMPPEPLRSMDEFQPRRRFFDFLLPRLKAKRVREADQRFEHAHCKWQIRKRTIEGINSQRDVTFVQAYRAWEEQKLTFEQRKAQHNASVDDLQRRYLERDAAAIEEYCDIVLSRSSYPAFFPQEFEIEYNEMNKILVVEYRLPAPSDVPKLREVRYLSTRDELKEIYLPESQANKMFELVCYQVSLRTVHEIFESDVVDAVAAVAFNGWVDFFDPATGRETKACILSLQVSKEEFEPVNLAKVDPKVCFRNLKGVSSARLHGLAPIPPIIRMTRSDPRFVESQDIAPGLQEGANLATIEWSDFEHLIREVFEAQFKQTGGEVKVTQASRDGGVDAIVFDPDPVRGGKIVIQAKRYTNPVGVSAVRDLYGTVMNEGAIKGILVTTSSYGPDAYKFAKNKPLTLIDGSNLLHLMSDLGHRVRINLKEAKELARG